ncbi:MAG: hypothetical protein HFI63_11620 [Lachnospiraceae bacterium]|nr:hypothetical protein [Lachnospiraceae bacterium]
MNKALKSTLRSVGISRHYRGYRYFILAITMAAEKPERLMNIHREIYTPIAQTCCTDPASVEKNLRTIRDVMIRNGGGTLLSQMTGNPCWENKPPYPRELIKIFAEYFAEELNQACDNV